MEDKVQEFLKKYEINPYAEDCFAMEEKLLSVPVEEFSDEVLEEKAVFGSAHGIFFDRDGRMRQSIGNRPKWQRRGGEGVCGSGGKRR